MAQDGYKACPYCAEPIRLQATVCRYCGRDLPPIQKTGLDLRKEKKTGFATYGCLEWGVLGIIGLVILAVFGQVGNGSNSTVSQPTSVPKVVVAPTLAATRILEPTKTPAPTATATPQWMAPSFEEICHRDPSLTDVQFEEYIKTFAGKKFSDWDGWVYDVYRYGEEYQLLIAMNEPGGLFWSRQIQIDDIGPELGVSLNKEQPIRFSGTIQEVGTFWGDSCNPLKVKDVGIVLR